MSAIDHSKKRNFVAKLYENGIIWVEVVQIMFYGSKVHCIDDKGRLTLSSIYRDGFTSQKCYACYGLDHCLELYPEETYIKKVSTITSLNDFDEKLKGNGKVIVGENETLSHMANWSETIIEYFFRKLF